MDKSERFWNRIAKNYDKDGKKPLKILGRIEKYLKTDDIVLDFGCATGSIVINFADQVREVYGIDISAKMISSAKRKASERKIENVNFAKTTVFDEKYTKGSFDVILAFNILHLLDEHHKVIQRIRELLKPGGIFISSTPCLGEKLKFMGIFLRMLHKTGILPPIKMFKTSELVGLMTEENFQIVEDEKFSLDKQSYFIVAKKNDGV